MYRLIDLFCGAGGMTLGFQLAMGGCFRHELDLLLTIEHYCQLFEDVASCARACAKSFFR